MAIKWRRRVVLAKIESVYGQDALPTGSANAILALDGTIVPMEGGTVTRDLTRPYLGAEEEIPVNTHVVCEFGVEAAGAGSAGTAPAYGVLLRACGLAETIDAGTDARYDPVSEDEEAVSMYFNVGGTLHKLLGARGSVSMRFVRGELPRFVFRFVGLWVNPEAQALPTPDFTGFLKPLPVNNANTPSFSLHGHAGVMESLTLDLGQQVEHRDLVNSESVPIVDRRGTGATVFEAPPLAEKDFFQAARAAELGALALVHGLSPGNIVELAAPSVQALRPRYSESQGITMLNLDLVLVPDAGDDELRIIVR